MTYDSCPTCIDRPAVLFAFLLWLATCFLGVMMFAWYSELYEEVCNERRRWTGIHPRDPGFPRPIVMPLWALLWMLMVYIGCKL